MSGHYIEKCSECGEIISQCRCAYCMKTVRYGICEKCQERRASKKKSEMNVRRLEVK
jgi:hypothetical protein